MLIAASQRTICSLSIQRVDDLCRNRPELSVSCICEDERVGWNSEKTFLNPLLEYCRFHYPFPYSPQADVITLQTKHMLVRTENDPLYQDYRITPAGEREAGHVHTRLSRALKIWQKESQKNLPKFYRGEIVFTAQPDFSTCCQPSGSFLVVMPASPRQLTSLEKVLLRLPRIPFL